jgi:hypothetical protein
VIVGLASGLLAVVCAVIVLENVVVMQDDSRVSAEERLYVQNGAEYQAVHVRK